MPTRITATLAAAVVIPLAIAACGGSSPAAGPPPRGLVAYSHCMRTHGVPDFPDPATGQGVPKDKVVALAGSPQFNIASSDCAGLMPSTGLASPPTAGQIRARTADALAFARCMRRRGFPTFPDPTTSGQLTHEMLSKAGIDLHQPAVLQGADGCAGVSHGLITRATVANFVAGR